MSCADLSAVIPGRPEGPGPESILPAGGYGFRARAFGAPRNDADGSISAERALAAMMAFVSRQIIRRRTRAEASPAAQDVLRAGSLRRPTDRSRRRSP